MKNEIIFKNEDITNNDNINENDEIISNKYKIIIYLGGGANGKVYMATKINDSNEKYAIKVLNKIKPYFKKIIKYVIKVISDLNSPYIIKMKDYGKGQIKLRGKEPKEIQYIAYEYASNGTLFDYLLEPYTFFEEKYAKIIFKSIAKGIQEMHNHNICHRDIKLENILLGPNFTPKICDFGSSLPIKKKYLTSLAGTEGYAAPEIMRIIKNKDEEEMNKNKDNNKQNNEDKKNEIGYDGKKADIFSLGVSLLELVTGEMYQNLYIYVEKNELDTFFETEVKKLLSIKVKELIKNLINYNPEERPDINEILKNEWLNDINENNIIVMEDYFIELNKRKKEIERQNEKRKIIINQNLNFEIKYDSRASPIKNNIPFFKSNYNLEYIDDNQIHIKDFIQINGLLDPLEFMNSIANKIKSEMNNKDIKGNEIGEYIIKEDNNYFKFQISLENEEEWNDEKREDETKEEENKEESEEEENEEEEIKEDFLVKSEDKFEEYEKSNFNFKKFIENNKLKIEVKLLESINGYHLLVFNKISGDIRKYKENLSKIISIIKNN